MRLIGEIFSCLAWLLVYAAIPVYVFGLLITIGLRDFATLFDLRDFAKNIFRKLL